MGQLMADDGGELILILGDLEQTAVDADLAARQGEGVDLLGVKHHHLPAGDAIAGRHLGGDRLGHAGDIGIHPGILAHLLLLLHLLEGVGPQLVHLLGGEEQHLAAAGRRLGTAGKQGTAQGCQAEFGQGRCTHERVLYREVALFSGMPPSGASQAPPHATKKIPWRQNKNEPVRARLFALQKRDYMMPSFFRSASTILAGTGT